MVSQTIGKIALSVSYRILLSCLLIGGLILVGCSSLPGGRDRLGLDQAVSAYPHAVASGDKALYMSLLATDDVEFLTEQSRWFDYRIAARIENFEVLIESVQSAGPNEYAVDNDSDWRIYGGMAGSVIDFLADYYGAEIPRRLVLALAAWLQERVGYGWSLHDRQLRDWLAEAIQSELGLSMTELDMDWRRWIGALHDGA
ncbi:MAG: hypothetical protein KKC64_07940 [Spirochaetes bacterium]|nr:hypothetical protein [Spirochaetota bacterium]